MMFLNPFGCSVLGFPDDNSDVTDDGEDRCWFVCNEEEDDDALFGESIVNSNIPTRVLTDLVKTDGDDGLEQLFLVNSTVCLPQNQQRCATPFLV